MAHVFEKPSYKESYKELSQDECKRAQDIAGRGDYNTIYTELETAHLLERHVATMKTHHGAHFEAQKFLLEEEDWKMLAILDLYDVATLQHSMRTFDIAHDMITRTLRGPHNENIRLQMFIQSEGVSLNQFLRAALFHDIGKVGIPREVLNNAFTESDIDTVLLRMTHDGRAQNIFQRIGCERINDSSDKNILQALHSAGYRSVDLVPIEEAFPQDQYPELIEAIDTRGFSKKQTLKDIIQQHELMSANILCADEVVADLVGHHHNYRHERSTRRISIDTLKMSTKIDEFAIIHLLTIADKTDALRSTRSYKEGFSELDIFDELIHDATIGRLNQAAVYLWVSNRYPEYQQGLQKNPSSQPTQHDTEITLRIETFLTSSQKVINATQQGV